MMSTIGEGRTEPLDQAKSELAHHTVILREVQAIAATDKIALAQSLPTYARGLS
jgi:hypothetical protein